jgi:hypothetical protein
VGKTLEQLGFALILDEREFYYDLQVVAGRVVREIDWL